MDEEDEMKSGAKSETKPAKLVKKGVHQHERKMHPGKKLTQLKLGPAKPAGK